LAGGAGSSDVEFGEEVGSVLGLRAASLSCTGWPLAGDSVCVVVFSFAGDDFGDGQACHTTYRTVRSLLTDLAVSAIIECDDDHEYTWVERDLGRCWSQI
jgi:hypothetical protein